MITSFPLYRAFTRRTPANSATRFALLCFLVFALFPFSALADEPIGDLEPQLPMSRIGEIECSLLRGAKPIPGHTDYLVYELEDPDLNTFFYLLYYVEKRQSTSTGSFNMWRGPVSYPLPSKCHLQKTISQQLLNQLPQYGYSATQYYKEMVADPAYEVKISQLKYTALDTFAGVVPVAGTVCYVEKCIDNDEPISCSTVAASVAGDVGGILLPFARTAKAGALLMGAAGATKMGEAAYYARKHDATGVVIASTEAFLYLLPTRGIIKRIKLPSLPTCKPCLQPRPVPAFCGVGVGAGSPRLGNGIFEPFENQVRLFGQGGRGILPVVELNTNPSFADKWKGLFMASAAKALREQGEEVGEITEKMWLEALEEGKHVIDLPAGFERGTTKLTNLRRQIAKWNDEIDQGLRQGKKIDLPPPGPWLTGLEEGVDAYIALPKLKIPTWQTPMVEIKNGTTGASKFFDIALNKWNSGQIKEVTPVIVGRPTGLSLQHVGKSLAKDFIWAPKQLQQGNAWRNIQSIIAELKLQNAPIRRTELPSWLALRLNPANPTPENLAKYEKLREQFYKNLKNSWDRYYTRKNKGCFR